MISNDFKVEDSSEICISSRELFPKQYCGTLKKVDFCGNLAAKLPTLKRDPKLTVKVTASDKSVTLKAIIDRGPQISEDRISQQSDWSIPSSGRGSMTASQGFSDSDTASLSQTSSKSSLQSFQAQGLLSARESDVAMIAIPSGGRSATSSSRTSADSGYSHGRTASLPDLSRREKLESQALAFLGQNEEMNEFNSSQLFIELSKNLGHEWKLFARSLGLTTAAIENIEADNSSQRERSYQVSIQWTRRGTASRTALYKAIMAVDPSGALMERLIAGQ
ncbi:uncharacterized protein LOC134195009 [Corticium candelabrum]|uniref:uncharacterized protein LOC134195009 n=1 Tax=Corticium candelabrum TaxID=121492 RepID=UPI002E268FF9|nr:uncharacterized protein LOC134195009 [Corticium candelabrum]